MRFKEKLIDKNLCDQLKKLYTTILKAPSDYSVLEIRKLCSTEFAKIFSNVKFILKGTENLPTESSSIFIYNHLNNHVNYSVFDDFQITLDSHFISSIILKKYYGSPGTRVVRCSLQDEVNHFNYYDKFDYVRVFAQNFIPPNINYSQIKTFNKSFYTKSINELKKGNGIVVSPEGFSRKTEESPGDFKIGVFKLATKLKPQPKIVPIIMANFDKLLSETTYKCEIMKPFKMSDHGINDENDPKLVDFVKDYNEQYKNWVKDLIREDLNFEGELKKLKKLVSNKKDTNNQLVFYGSSTIRLWERLASDFSNFNTINLGFGGALIQDLNKNFNDLFKSLNPKYIVTYLGGNDLTLNYSSEKISQKIIEFFKKITERFPNTSIINLSIKPSFERIKDIEKIEKINSLIKTESKTNNKLIQLEFYNELMIGNKINSDFYLQDGLHLNTKGYEIIIKKLKQLLKNLD